MANEIVSYIDMCQREGTSLQRGMNYGLGGTYSVILMSLRSGAPYQDKVENDGATIVYEGHDVPKSDTNPFPKTVDQQGELQSGVLTQNGKFAQAAREYRAGTRAAELMRVYEKIKQGIWSYNGVFQLVNAWQERVGKRSVFKFELRAINEEIDQASRPSPALTGRRVIPTWVKLDVWKRDGGKCSMCGSTDELHFDHIIPFSKGGSSNTPDNIQLLCARHNLSKSDRIE